jgi:methyl-accepting chemotaxis protein
MQGLFDKKEESLSSHTNTLHAKTNDFIEKVQAITQKQQTGAEAILAQATMLNDKIEQSFISHQKTIDSLGVASTSIKDGALRMDNVSEKLKSSSDALQETGNTLSTSMKQILEGSKDVIRANEENTKIVTAMNKTLLADLNKFDMLLENFTSLVQNTENTFDGLKTSQKDYLDSLAENVNNLRQKMQEALENYAEKANGQTGALLHAWQQGTNEYTTSMKNAVSSISQLVEEIDEKIGNINK